MPGVKSPYHRPGYPARRLTARDHPHPGLRTYAIMPGDQRTAYSGHYFAFNSLEDKNHFLTEFEQFLVRNPQDAKLALQATLQLLNLQSRLPESDFLHDADINELSELCRANHLFARRVQGKKKYGPTRQDHTKLLFLYLEQSEICGGEKREKFVVGESETDPILKMIAITEFVLKVGH